MKIRILTLGSLKETYWREAQQEYRKRLSTYADLTIEEIPEESFRAGYDRDRMKKKEAEKILKRISNDAVVIALDEQGATFSSTEFAQWMERTAMYGDDLTFVIGGPLGLHASLRERAQHRIALSSLTFTHQMARVILLEQLYRASTIIQHTSYHY